MSSLRRTAPPTDLAGPSGTAGVEPAISQTAARWLLMVLDLGHNSSATRVFVSTSTIRPDVTTKELRNMILRYVALTSSSTSHKDATNHERTAEAEG